MKNKEGFVLIECCAYLMICAILTITIMRWIAQTALEAGRSVQSTDRAMISHVAHDVLMRDLRTAPSEPTRWLKRQPDHIVWKKDERTAVGWHLHNHQLIRKEGHYDSVLHKWSEHHTSIVAYGVSTYTCELDENDNAVKGIKTTICLESGTPSSRYLRMRNGRV